MVGRPVEEQGDEIILITIFDSVAEGKMKLQSA